MARAIDVYDGEPPVESEAEWMPEGRREHSHPTMTCRDCGELWPFEEMYFDTFAGDGPQPKWDVVCPACKAVEQGLVGFRDVVEMGF